jgi:hypothetical protein
VIECTTPKAGQQGLEPRASNNNRELGRETQRHGGGVDGGMGMEMAGGVWGRRGGGVRRGGRVGG